jgi:hypothetical protein
MTVAGRTAEQVAAAAGLTPRGDTAATQAIDGLIRMVADQRNNQPGPTTQLTAEGQQEDIREW